MAKDDRHSLPPMEWLRSFEAAGRLGNFTAAANEIGLTQASVSQHIRALEGRLGILLFRRLARGVELTADGEAYLPHIETALSVIKHGTTDLFGRAKKRISIAAPASVSSLWVAPRLKTIAESNALLEISLASIHREVDYEAIESDYQIRYGNGNWPGLNAVLLYSEILTPACSPEILENATNGDWKTLPILSVKGRRDGWREWAKAKNTSPVRAPHLRFDSFMTALIAAEAGAGVLLASLPLIQQQLKTKSLTLLEKDSHKMSTGAWITWPQQYLPDRNHEKLIDQLTSGS